MFGPGHTCKSIDHLIQRGLDEELTTREQRRCDSHLAQCAECRRAESFYRDLKAASGELERVAPPAHLWERIELQLDEHPWGDEDVQTASPRSTRSFWLDLGGAAAALLLILALTLMPQQSPVVLTADGPVLLQEYTTDVQAAYLSLYMMAQADRFPPEVRDYYLNRIDGLDHKIRTITSMLEQYPHNRVAKVQLAELYQQKLVVYKEIGLTGHGGPLNRTEENRIL